MKEKKSYNLLITIWLWVVLIGILPVLGRNLLVSLQFGMGVPAYYKVPYALLILGGLVYLCGYILLACKRKSGVWLVFLSLPVAYALAQLDLYFFGLPGSGSGGVMFLVYVILPLLLNLVTAGLLFLRRRGRVRAWTAGRSRPEGRNTQRHTSQPAGTLFEPFGDRRVRTDARILQARES